MRAFDNAKTAVVRGAGAWGQLNESYRRYAMTLRFHIAPCTPYSPVTCRAIFGPVGR